MRLAGAAQVVVVSQALDVVHLILLIMSSPGCLNLIPGSALNALHNDVLRWAKASIATSSLSSFFCVCLC